MNEKESGKKYPDSCKNPKYWMGLVGDMSQGKITAKELVDISGNYLMSLGMVWSEIWGWIYPKDLTRTSMELNDIAVPTITVSSAAEGRKLIIKPEFLRELERRKRQDRMTGHDFAVAQEFISTVGELFQEKERPF